MVARRTALAPSPVSLSLWRLLHSLLAGAQTVPNAGTVRQQIEQDRQPALPPKSGPLFLPPPPMASIGGASVTVTGFKFAGNTLLTSKKLSPVVAGFVGRPLTFADLQNAAIAVANEYRRAGWVVKAYLPQQDITGGTVTIQIVEAKFGAVRIEGSTQRSSNGRLKGIVDAAQKPGTALSADALDRAPVADRRSLGVVATGSLSEGEPARRTSSSTWKDVRAQWRGGRRQRRRAIYRRGAHHREREPQCAVRHRRPCRYGDFAYPGQRLSASGLLAAGRERGLARGRERLAPHLRHRDELRRAR